MSQIPDVVKSWAADPRYMWADGEIFVKYYLGGIQFYLGAVSVWTRGMTNVGCQVVWCPNGPQDYGIDR